MLEDIKFKFSSGDAGRAADWERGTRDVYMYGSLSHGDS